MSISSWLSVLIPTYNGESYLSTALDSVVAQNAEDVEYIAIDDGSTDLTLSILNSYQKKIPMKIVQRERAGNWVANTNYALSIAKGRYVCFLHQDDVWFSERLKIMKRLTDEFPGIVMFLNPSYYLDSDGNVLGLWQCPLPSVPMITNSEKMVQKLLIQNFISIPAPVFKKDVSHRIGGLDESAWYAADWDFWLKIAREGDVGYYPAPLSGFRIHSMSQTIVRSSYLHEFRTQLETVFLKHFESWENSNNHKETIRKVGTFSINVNVTLAGIIHKKQSTIIKLMLDFLMLGPMGWHLYFMNSRIWERVTARLRAQLRIRQKSIT